MNRDLLILLFFIMNFSFLFSFFFLFNLCWLFCFIFCFYCLLSYCFFSDFSNCFSFFFSFRFNNFFNWFYLFNFSFNLSFFLCECRYLCWLLYFNFLCENCLSGIIWFWGIFFFRKSTWSNVDWFYLFLFILNSLCGINCFNFNFVLLLSLRFLSWFLLNFLFSKSRNCCIFILCLLYKNNLDWKSSSCLNILFWLWFIWSIRYS